MKITWLGPRFFGPDLPALGHDLRILDVPRGEVWGWAELCAASGWQPDAVVVADRSEPPFVIGQEAFPCLTVFYAVDTHIHSWYPYYAQGFDLVLVSLRDDLDLFRGKELDEARVIWCPPCMIYPCSPTETASLPGKEWGLLFVGKVDTNLNPERADFLRRLGGLFPALHVCSGNFQELFPKGRLLLNHSISGDLNFRVFEALGCGGCLLTPCIAQGQDEIFRDGEDFFLYDPGDLPGLAALAARLLKDPALCARVAASGHAKVTSRHLGRHRASMLSRALGQCDAAALVAQRLERKNAIRKNYLKFIYLLLAESVESPARRKAYLAAAVKND
ncbi:glycosyltransferase [Desulfovibrio sp. OttesenSCG-928-C14]|nr:glycosyltransferase [Desulfovibrio sp. OttesenSCG-928-C14]